MLRRRRTGLLLAAGLAIGAGAASGAGPADPAARAAGGGRRALEGHVWPAGIAFVVSDTADAPTGAPLELSPSVVEGAVHEERFVLAGPDLVARAGLGGKTPVPGLSLPRDPIAAEIAEHGRLALELGLSAINVRQSGSDLAKLAATHADRASLLPVLLFLVEQGVMERAEMDAFLADPDVDGVIAKIEERARKLEEERDRHQVLAYLKGIKKP